MKVCIHRGTKQIGGSCIELEHAGARIPARRGAPLDGACDDRSLLPRLTAGIEGVVVPAPASRPLWLAAPLASRYAGLHRSSRAVDHPGSRAVYQPAAARTGWHRPAGSSADPDRPVPDHALSGRPLGLRCLRPADRSWRQAALLQRRLPWSWAQGGFRAAAPASPRRDRRAADGGYDAVRLDEPYAFHPGTISRTNCWVTCRSPKGWSWPMPLPRTFDRIVTVYRACKRANRTLVIDLYTAAILEATGNAHIPQSFWPGVALFTPQRQRRQIVGLQAFELLKRHAVQRIYQDALSQPPQAPSRCFVPCMEDLQAAGVLAGARFIYSQWSGYLQEASSRPWRDWLQSRASRCAISTPRDMPVPPICSGLPRRWHPPVWSPFTALPQAISQPVRQGPVSRGMASGGRYDCYVD